MMQEKEPMSRADFETILWPEIKEKIIPHLGNEFKAYDRNKELEGKFFSWSVVGLSLVRLARVSLARVLPCRKLMKHKKQLKLRTGRKKRLNKTPKMRLKTNPKKLNFLIVKWKNLKTI